MANTYFQFKEFIIHQDQSAMKVSTDACIFGAMINFNKQKTTVLDIGAGTGLLSLMIAQQHNQAQVTAVEIDNFASKNCRQNFSLSSCSNRLSVIEDDIKNINNEHQFDVIVSNPPFFNNHLKSHNNSRLLARHDDHLNKKDLAKIIHNLLKEDGEAWILLPNTEWQIWLDYCMNYNIFLKEEIAIHPFNDHPANRFIGVFTKNKNAKHNKSTFVIYKEPNRYTYEMITLLSPFYLDHLIEKHKKNEL